MDVPSGSATIPATWWHSGSATADAAWNTVMQGTTSVVWTLGDTQNPAPSASWRAWADNARISFSHGPSTYCSAQTGDLGCTPSLQYIGTPSVSSPGSFTLFVTEVRSQEAGLFLYGFSRATWPFGGGFVCVGQPLRRGPMLPTGGNLVPNCTGSLQWNLNAIIQSGVDPLLVAGATVYTQGWSRDPGAANGSNLSNALRLTICP